MKSEKMSPILITVDLEDWFQVENLRPSFPLKSWHSLDFRLENNTHAILDLFDRYGVQATFFCLGWNAHRCRRLIQEIQRRGHEVGSHGYDHEMCGKLSIESLREDLLRSKDVLESITGMPVLGYRSPNFSITPALIDHLG